MTDFPMHPEPLTEAEQEPDWYTREKLAEAQGDAKSSALEAEWRAQAGQEQQRCGACGDMFWTSILRPAPLCGTCEPLACLACAEVAEKADHLAEDKFGCWTCRPSLDPNWEPGDPDGEAIFAVSPLLDRSYPAVKRGGVA